MYAAEHRVSKRMLTYEIQNFPMSFGKARPIDMSRIFNHQQARAWYAVNDALSIRG